MKLLLSSTLVALFSTSLVHANETGNFRMRSLDFATLYNHADRAVQPEQIPWAGSFFPYGYDGIADTSEQDPSPAERYDRAFNGGRLLATSWEKENHSCGNVDSKYRQGCKDWWGHCNAWAAAAIKEVEPRSELRKDGKTFSVADQKAYLTELWMDSDSLFAGETDKGTATGDWVYDPSSREARKPLDYGTGTTYDAFWDLTPRAFFNILTNYVGLMGTSVIIDKFAGDQVWNHPIAGYRLLPIRKQDRLDPVTRRGRTLYPVLLRMKLYWTNDGVAANHVTTGFDIRKTRDNESVSPTWQVPDEFEGRLLKFTLFFNAPVETNTTGTEVLSAGRVVGEGIWHHQQYPVDYPDETHPDFVWLPTDLLSGSGQANPYIDEAIVHDVVRERGSAGSSEGRPSQETVAVFAPGVFRSKNAEVLARLITWALAREGVQARVSADQIEIAGDGSVKAVLTVEGGTDLTRMSNVLTEAGFTPSTLVPKE